MHLESIRIKLIDQKMEIDRLKYLFLDIKINVFQKLLKLSKKSFKPD